MILSAEMNIKLHMSSSDVKILPSKTPLSIDMYTIYVSIITSIIKNVLWYWN